MAVIERTRAHRIRTWPVVAGVAFALAAAGCGGDDDDDGPRFDDPAAVESDLESAFLALQSPTVGGYGIVAAGADFATQLEGVSVGTTLEVADPALGPEGYEATSRPGAPPTGVRYILYTPDLPGGGFRSPLTEVGYFDFTEESATQFGIVVNDAGGVVGDYTVSVSGAAGAYSVTASGYLSSDAERLDFDGEASTTGSGRSADVTFTVTDPDLTARSVVELNATQGTAALDFTLERPGETVTLEGTLTGTLGGGIGTTVAVDATVSVDGEEFATIEGDITVEDGAGGLGIDFDDPALDALTITGADNRELSDEEVDAVQAVFAASVGTFAGFEVLVRPVVNLLELEE